MRTPRPRRCPLRGPRRQAPDPPQYASRFRIGHCAGGGKEMRKWSWSWMWGFSCRNCGADYCLACTKSELRIPDGYRCKNCSHTWFDEEGGEVPG